MQAKEYGGPKREILIDVGTADPHLEKQLKPDDFREAAASNKALDVQLRKQARTRTVTNTPGQYKSGLLKLLS